jgi:SAM-dependent methyltransferase
MLAFCDTLLVTRDTRVLDVGGTFYNWSLLPAERRPRLTLVNLDPAPSAADRPADVTFVLASALALPFGPGDFDVVFSNSVIEHVGNWEAQRRCADEIRRLGAPYWVQTPNYYFPVEPHFLGLGIQFLPRQWALPYARWASAWGWSRRWNRAEVDAALDGIRLLTSRDMRALFPESSIRRERALGLTKSLMAIHMGGATDRPV